METRAVRNHNPLNIRKGDNWQGRSTIDNDKEFVTFINDAYGFRAAFRIIHNGFKAKPPRNTIRQIISRWAPPEDNNDTINYINYVSRRTKIGPDTKLAYQDVGRMVDIVAAMAKMESGKEYDVRVILTGYELEK